MTIDNEVSIPDAVDQDAIVNGLLSKCERLISEVDSFQSLVKQTMRNPQLVEVRQMRSNLVSEIRALEKLQGQIESSTPALLHDPSEEGDDDDDDDESQLRLAHGLRSSNLPFYETVWTVAKTSCTGLVAFWKRFYWDDGESALKQDGDERSQGKRQGKNKRKSVLVDIVADGGEEWVKVSTVPESRLLFEIAEKGWEVDTDASSDGEQGEGSASQRVILRNYDSNDEGQDHESDDDDEIELIKLAAGMRKAANATRVRYRHPRIRFVLPKIEEGKVAEIDHMLEVIRRYDITVVCGNNMPSAMRAPLEETALPGPDNDSHQEQDLSDLLPTPYKSFTPTLNVDCTLLLAMVSDLSHFKHIPPLPNHHLAIKRQIDAEKQKPLLPLELWPAVRGHELVCTEEAAKRFREIVQTIGTETEKERTEIMMGAFRFQNADPETLFQKYQELSDHSVPQDWKLPIRVVEAKTVISSALTHGKLPPVAHLLAETISHINQSVFFYGWVTGITTISSNRTVVKQIETVVEGHRGSDDALEGPHVWICDTARSLVGKEKDRKK
ncbi:hypothetical protein ASPZODRAFT_148362 [Penicilliopsis zonata CBS 506.65]|uniref:DUF1308 domain-containing protein n=1 Tax=Penicilliopsis zonata CBS 506.65 TaxID=1073090 RepID=A0A1L9SUT9_9EURO|nr:hypothetical protein ASPZODRAFT_148362 [Penicilliopsis zonata CBS 506.65]OJJ50985.1 hypothetical protein ASPZODRAFT_148362 [Penicilliopsis zonata CBS 506.65]